jgi:hypothetical protein
VYTSRRQPSSPNRDTDEYKLAPTPLEIAQFKLVEEIQDVVAHRVFPTLAVGVRFVAPKSEPLIVSLGPAVVGEL